MKMSKEYSINYKINAKIVDVVMPGGGIRNGLSLSDAVTLAQDLGLDLVEVSPAQKDKNPICKVLDHGKLKYKEGKRKKAHKQVVKEIKFNFHIDDHDLQVKNNKVKKFLDKRYQIKYSIEMRGRERGSVDSAKERFNKSLEQFKEVASWTPVKVASGGRMTRITTVISPL